MGGLMTQDSTGFVLDHCHHVGTVAADAGGLAGSGCWNFKLTYCSGQGQLTGDDAGGLVGSYAGDAIGWYDTKELTPPAAGIKSIVVVKHSKYNGQMADEIVNAGGILGSNMGSILVVADNTIVSSKVIIEKCQVVCNVGSSTDSSTCGGICGNLSAGIDEDEYNTNTIVNSVVIKNCSITGDIYGAASGGVAGPTFGYSSETATDSSITSNILIEKCAHKGNIYGDNAGGILSSENSGYIYTNSPLTSTFVVTKCLHHGNIYGDNAAGIIGGLDCVVGTALIDNCYATGYLTIVSWGIAGVPDAANLLTVQNCYTNGHFDAGMTATDGIAGSASTIINCYSRIVDVPAGIRDVHLLISKLDDLSPKFWKKVKHGYPVLNGFRYYPWCSYNKSNDMPKLRSL
jgi:hypothetical protein